MEATSVNMLGNQSEISGEKTNLSLKTKLLSDLQTDLDFPTPPTPTHPLICVHNIKSQPLVQNCNGWFKRSQHSLGDKDMIMSICKMYQSFGTPKTLN